jgi:hypothetical protein
VTAPPVGAASAAALLAFAPGMFSCVHLPIRDAGPGTIDLWQPPAALAAPGATLPRRPPATAVAVSPGVLAGAGWRNIRGGGNSGGASLGFELGLHRARVRRTETGEDGQLDFGGERDAWWGVNVGWTPSETRTSSTSSRAILPPSMYVELQWSRLVYGLAAGAALSPGDLRRERAGLQVVPMSGPLFLRLQLLLDGTFATELGVALKLPVLISF